MLQIGILFVVLGFGSLVLEQMGREFLLISWASSMQPVFGIVLGVVGIAVVAAHVVLQRRKAGTRPATPQQQ